MKELSDLIFSKNQLDQTIRHLNEHIENHQQELKDGAFSPYNLLSVKSEQIRFEKYLDTLQSQIENIQTYSEKHRHNFNALVESSKEADSVPTLEAVNKFINSLTQPFKKDSE